MRISTACTVAAAIAGVNAITLVKRTNSAPRVVSGTIQRKHVEDPIARDQRRFRKRASDTLTVTLDNEETLYFMNVSVGTPAQDFRLHIDTGSSDLWVNTPDSRLCENRNNDCSVSGTYNANDSSTYKFLNSNFNITYVDGSGATGDYALDTVSFGGSTLKQQQFGIGYTSTSAEGVLGIGYPINEVAASMLNEGPYPNVPQNLLLNGVIASNAYSLWLNDLDSSTGSILFGGVNTEKYTGSLETLPIIQEEGVYAEFIIALTGVGMNGNSGSIAKNLASPALLDSGTSLMYLPNDVTSAIYNATNAQYNANQGAAFVDCNLANSGDTIDFTFSSPTISIGMNELVIVAGEEGGEEVCILGIAPAQGSMPVLGDTFLRSAYVVYDLTSNQISLAQTKFNVTSDNIMEITNSTGVPDATVVQNAVTNVAVSSNGAHIDTGSFGSTIISFAAAPTAAPSWNMALFGAAGAAGVAAVLAL